MHNAIYSRPQRADDPAWNVANCRNRRIFDDRAGLSAARNVRPYLIQSYPRDMGNGVVIMMREIDAPIRVFGQSLGRLPHRLQDLTLQRLGGVLCLGGAAFARQQHVAPGRRGP